MRSMIPVYFLSSLGEIHDSNLFFSSLGEICGSNMHFSFFGEDIYPMTKQVFYYNSQPRRRVTGAALME